jgi:hypothetical protein
MEMALPFDITLEYGNHPIKMTKWNDKTHNYTHFVRFNSPKSVGFPINWIVKRVGFRGL